MTFIFFYLTVISGIINSLDLRNSSAVWPLEFIGYHNRQLWRGPIRPLKGQCSLCVHGRCGGCDGGHKMWKRHFSGKGIGWQFYLGFLLHAHNTPHTRQIELFPHETTTAEIPPLYDLYIFLPHRNFQYYKLVRSTEFLRCMTIRIYRIA